MDRRKQKMPYKQRTQPTVGTSQDVLVVDNHANRNIFNQHIGFYYFPNTTKLLLGYQEP